MRSPGELDALEFDEVWVSVLSDNAGICEQLTGRGIGHRLVFPGGKHLQVQDELPRTLESLTSPLQATRELMKRVFRIDALKCATCGSGRRRIAAITSGEAITKILEHLDVPSIVADPAPRRAPPQAEFGFEGC